MENLIRTKKILISYDLLILISQDVDLADEKYFYHSFIFLPKPVNLDFSMGVRFTLILVFAICSVTPDFPVYEIKVAFRQTAEFADTHPRS